MHIIKCCIMQRVSLETFFFFYTFALLFLFILVGRLLIEFSSQMTMERVQKENPNVTEGGRYTPPDCRPRWKVCERISVHFMHTPVY